MKGTFKSIFIAILSITCVSFVFLLSCNNSNSSDCLCTVHGICKNGTCICAAGYDGSQCQTLIQQQYIGDWTCIQTCTGTSYLALNNTNPFVMSIDSSTQSPLIVQINNISNDYHTIFGSVTLDSVYINPQVMYNGDTLQGWGTYQLSGSTYGQHAKLTLNIMVNNNGKSDTCVIQANK